jgi:hypothetical protein
MASTRIVSAVKKLVLRKENGCWFYGDRQVSIHLQGDRYSIQVKGSVVIDIAPESPHHGPPYTITFNGDTGGIMSIKIPDGNDREVVMKDTDTFHISLNHPLIGIFFIQTDDSWKETDRIKYHMKEDE